MHNTNKLYKKSKFAPLVGNILRQEWDPIGLRNIPDAPGDEYDSYVGEICSLLDEVESSNKKIMEHLLEIESQRMGVRLTEASRERCRRVADRLLDARSKQP